MRIIGHVVAKNEADRFLAQSLEWNQQWLDDLHVYDDRSEDATLTVALRYTEKVGTRPSDGVPFSESESEFRQAAWENMIEVCNPTSEDWILAIDADEFVLGNHKQDPRQALEETAHYIDAVGLMAASIKRIIVWEWGMVPQVRIDGQWAKDRQVRLAKFNPKAKTFKKNALGCGSLPQYAAKSAVSNVTYCSIMDLGYAIEGEPERKHQFYTTRTGDAHSKAHIDSIVQAPKLTEWRGPVPQVI